MEQVEFLGETALVYLGLGSNQNDPKQQLQKAVIAIGQWRNCHLQACSSLYRSRALPKYDHTKDNSQQADFYNIVLSIRTSLTPRQLLLLAKTQESQHGRSFIAGHYADRNLDIDILLYNQEIIKEKGLIIPHPRLEQRDFVLRPLLELAPGLTLPGKNSRQCLAAMCNALTINFILEVKPFEKNHDSSTTTV